VSIAQGTAAVKGEPAAFPTGPLHAGEAGRELSIVVRLGA